MENTTAIEKLIEKAEIYSKTTLELCKFKAVYKSADILSTIAVKLAITTVLVMFSLLANIGFALWIGKELGETYYGFFIVAFGYLVFGLFLYILRYDWIKVPVSNFIINRIKKQKNE